MLFKAGAELVGMTSIPGKFEGSVQQAAVRTCRGGLLTHSRQTALRRIRFKLLNGMD